MVLKERPAVVHAPSCLHRSACCSSLLVFEEVCGTARAPHTVGLGQWGWVVVSHTENENNMQKLPCHLGWFLLVDPGEGHPISPHFEKKGQNGAKWGSLCPLLPILFIARLFDAVPAKITQGKYCPPKNYPKKLTKNKG